MDRRAAADNAYLVVAGDFTFKHIAPGYRTDIGFREQFPYFRRALRWAPVFGRMLFVERVFYGVVKTGDGVQTGADYAFCERKQPEPNRFLALRRSNIRGRFLGGLHGLRFFHRVVFGVDFRFTPFSPFIGCVVVAHIAQRQIVLALVPVRNDANFFRDAGGPASAAQLFQAKPWPMGVADQIEKGRLYGFLFVILESGEAVQEGVVDAEMHGVCM